MNPRIEETPKAGRGPAQSGLEIIQSLRREGWREDIMGVVLTSSDRQLVQVVWPDGKRAEARMASDAATR